MAFSRSFRFREGSLTALLFIYVWGLAGQLVTCRWITGYRDWAEVVMTLTAELGLHRVKLNILGINQSDAVFHLRLNCSHFAS